MDRSCCYCHSAESQAEWECKYGLTHKEFCTRECKELYSFCIIGINFEEYYGIATKIAKNYQRLTDQSLDIEDLAQNALLALIEQKSNFDASRGTFKKWATFVLFSKIFATVEKQLHRKKALSKRCAAYGVPETFSPDGLDAP